MDSGPPSPLPPFDPSQPAGRYPPYREEAGRQGAPSGGPSWVPPASLPGSALGGEPVRSRLPAMFELRPLTTGELLDRTFSLYRSRFWLFAGISSLAAIFQTAGQAVQLVVQHALIRRGNLITANVTSWSLSVVISVVFWLIFSLTQAATVWAVSEVYLRREATVKSALAMILPRWYRFMGIAAWQVGSAAWPVAAVSAVFFGLAFVGRKSLATAPVAAGLAVFLMFLLVAAAVVVGFVLYLRNLLGVPAAVVEQLTVRPAMRRSKQLVPGAKGKLFLVLLISALLYGVVGTLAGVLLVFGLIPGVAGKWQIVAQGIGLGVNFLGYSVVSPVAMVGITLAYFDQRVRREAFDVAVLLGDYATPLFAGPGAFGAPGAAVVQSRPGPAGSVGVKPAEPTQAPAGTLGQFGGQMPDRIEGGSPAGPQGNDAAPW